MKTLRDTLITVAIAFVVSIIVVGVYHLAKNDKVAYVRTGIVLQNFKGIKEAEKQVNKELLVVQTNIDTLRKRYEYLSYQYVNKGRGDKALETRLSKAQNDYQQYREKAAEQMEQRKNDLIGKEIAKINQLVEMYGKRHGYKLILGSTTEGNLLYGNPADDITDLIIEFINKE